MTETAGLVLGALPKVSDLLEVVGDVRRVHRKLVRTNQSKLRKKMRECEAGGR